MPTDAVDLPFQRPSAIAAAGMPGTVAAQVPGALGAENILLAEFGHASIVAYQSQEERTALLDHYLVLAGIVATACGIAGTYAFEAHVIGPILAIDVALPMFTLISFGFFTRLMHLGQKHEEALVAMNMIKEYYLHHLNQAMPHLHHAFRWRATHHRSRSSSGTTFFTASIIALTSSFSLAVAAEILYYMTHSFGHAIGVAIYLGPIRIAGILVDAPVFLVTFAAFGLYYVRARRRMRVSAHAGVPALMPSPALPLEEP